MNFEYYEDYDDQGGLVEYDDDHDYEVEDDYIDEGNPLRTEASFSEVYESCIEPSLAAALSQLGTPMLYCFIYSMVLRLVPWKEYVFHALSVFFGYLCLAHLVGDQAIYTVILCFLLYGIAWIVNSSRSERSFWLVLQAYMLYMVAREYFNPLIPLEDWNQVRGIHMLCFLRALSLNFEFCKGQRETPLGILEYAGYMLNPGTILFGPWIPYSNYLMLYSHTQRRVTTRWFIQTIMAFTLTMGCLAVSSCGVYWIFLGLHSKWIFAIRDAMSVRFSHYFICYASELLLSLSGCHSTSAELQSVTSPWNIEIPRSLVEVVVNWNKPMHRWLKNYIFRPILHAGPFKAVICTFLVSSMLHGLHFPVTMVLLSLGWFTYIEHTMREKLAAIFEACIRSRRCSSTCEHKYKSSNILVAIANIIFSLLAYFYLVYVGVMMDVREGDDTENSKWELMTAQIERWNSLGFSSHWISLCTYVAMSAI